jgi:CheY-like chemotaxis protein
MKEVFKLSNFPIHLNVARDGVDALAFLRREGSFSYAVEPDMILLDLNMPRKDGREALAEIRQEPRWRHIPVLILTNSREEEDVHSSYRLQANFYIVKPMDMDHLAVLMKYLEDFWIKNIHLSSGGVKDGK